MPTIRPLCWAGMRLRRCITYGHDQVVKAAEHSTAKAVLGEVTEEPLPQSSYELPVGVKQCKNLKT